MATKAATTKRKTTARKTTTRRTATATASKGPKVSKHGGVDPEWHNDPERLASAEELDQMKAWKDRGEIKVQTPVPISHNQITIDFRDLRPETDFELKITGPLAQPYYATLKSDGWGQAQLIWTPPIGGTFTVTAKGPGIEKSADFEVRSYDADRDYRSAKRAAHQKKGRGKAKATEAVASVATVEDPAVMGEPTAAETKNQPTEEELEDPEKFDPSFATAEPRPTDPDSETESTAQPAEKED